MKTRIRENINTPEKNSQSFLNMLIYFSLVILIGAIFVYLWNTIGYMSFIFLPIILVKIFLVFGRIRKYFQNKIITFQEVKGNSLVKEYPRNINFMNHHNYFKNYELEKRYKKYIYLKKIMKGWSFILGIIILFYFLPEIFFGIIGFIFALGFFITLLVWKDRLVNKLKGKKSSALLKHDIIYFRRINPGVFQKSGDTIFFY